MTANPVPWLVIRFDDIQRLCGRLAMLWDLLEASGVPLNLEIIPAGLSEEEASALRRRAERSETPVAFHQHGFQHRNYGTDVHRFEFGDSRGFENQLADIRNGRARLESRPSNP